MFALALTRWLERVAVSATPAVVSVQGGTLIVFRAGQIIGRCVTSFSVRKCRFRDLEYNSVILRKWQ